jgi:hypothetical protein
VHWEKLGQVVTPNDSSNWMSHYAGPSFARSFGEGIEVFVTGRDGFNQSRLGRVVLHKKRHSYELTEVGIDPFFDLGEIGTFDESGVSYPWLLSYQDRELMYYVGWVSGGKNRFQNFTGLAIRTSSNDQWERWASIPVLDRTPTEPLGTGSCAVFEYDGALMMLYTAFEPWLHVDGGANRPSYNIKIATSEDGIQWNRKGLVAIDFENEDEYVIGKPCVLFEGGVWHVWYSVRGKSYRIGYASGKSPYELVRRDQEVGIDVARTGWDSEMIEYAHVFRHQEDILMLYNGNAFGKTGLGIARLEGGSFDA